MEEDDDYNYIVRNSDLQTQPDRGIADRGNSLDRYSDREFFSPISIHEGNIFVDFLANSRRIRTEDKTTMQFQILFEGQLTPISYLAANSNYKTKFWHKIGFT